MTNCREHVNRDGTGYGEHKWGFSCALLKGHKGEHNPYPEVSRQGVTPSDELVSIKSKIKRANEKLSTLRAAENEASKTTLVTCLGWSIDGGSGNWSGCGTQFPVNQLTYIQTHWYTRPYSCNEGDYWNLGEGQFKCPACGHINRLYERPEVAALKQFFVKVEDTYDR
jgi:hypothetical protein